MGTPQKCGDGSSKVRSQNYRDLGSSPATLATCTNRARTVNKPLSNVGQHLTAGRNRRDRGCSPAGGLSRSGSSKTGRIKSATRFANQQIVSRHLPYRNGRPGLPHPAPAILRSAPGTIRPQLKDELSRKLGPVSICLSATYCNKNPLLDPPQINYFSPV